MTWTWNYDIKHAHLKWQNGLGVCSMNLQLWAKVFWTVNSELAWIYKDG